MPLFSGQEKTSGRELQILLEVVHCQHILERLVHRGCGQGPHIIQHPYHKPAAVQTISSPLRIFSHHTCIQVGWNKGGGGCPDLVCWAQELAAKSSKVPACAWGLDVCISGSLHVLIVMLHQLIPKARLRRRYKCWCPRGQRLSQKSKVSWHFPLYQYKPGPSIGTYLKGSKKDQKRAMG